MNPYRVAGGIPTEESRKPIKNIEERLIDQIDVCEDLEEMTDLLDLLDYTMGLKK